ncbi:MAG TPA: hypothetical protein VG797_05900 [Phycisphaerales bacterium]|nr:hypothetical protein [Phycisphaerales bacterium]
MRQHCQSSFPRIRLMVGLCLAFIFACEPFAARAQDVKAQLAEKPFTIPSLGLSIHLPEGAIIESSRLEGLRTSVIVRPPETKAQWVIQLHNSVSSDTGLTLESVMNSIVDQHKQRRVARDPKTGRDLESYISTIGKTDDLRLGDIPARRVYLGIANDPAEPVTGYTVLQTGAGRFVIIQLVCPFEAFENGVKHLYEMAVASATIRDPEESGSDRAAAILAGDAFLRSINASDFESCFDPEPVFYRVYRPATTGSASDAEEIAWQRIQMRLGQLGELSPSKRKETWSTEEREFGYVVRADARTFLEGTLLDSEGVFFLSRDRAAERWTIRNVVTRQGAAGQQHLTLTVVRRDRRMTVLTDQSGQPPSTVEYDLPEQGYISKVESYFLPRFAVVKNTAANFAFYNYDTSLGKVVLRRESFSSPQSGAWEQATLHTEDSAAPMLTTLDAQGRIIRQRLGQGQFMEPIDQDRLKSLWEHKELPTPPEHERERPRPPKRQPNR